MLVIFSDGVINNHHLDLDSRPFHWVGVGEDRRGGQVQSGVISAGHSGVEAGTVNRAVVECHGHSSWGIKAYPEGHLNKGRGTLRRRRALHRKRGRRAGHRHPGAESSFSMVPTETAFQ